VDQVPEKLIGSSQNKRGEIIFGKSRDIIKTAGCYGEDQVPGN
jgi:hypothetical protein